MAGETHDAKQEAHPTELERRLLDAHSFDEAVDYLASAEKPQGLAPIVLAGLSLAAVVAYSRPFTAQYDRDGEREPKEVRDLYLEVVHEAEQQELHDHVLDLRSQYLAHYDAARAKVRTFGDPPTLEYMAPTPLTTDQAETLSFMANSMSSRALQRLDALKETVGRTEGAPGGALDTPDAAEVR